MKMDERRVADYFVVAGLPEQPEILDDFTRDGVHLKSSHDQAPITDIAIIFPSLGELAPPEFTVIESTPSGYMADLNHGSLRSPDVYLCYRRGRDKPPLVDIGVMYEGKERIMSDSEVVLTTPGGRPANVNNSASKIYVTYRRANSSMPCNELVVTDICVILTNKGETAPHAFCMINKNLNKGMVGSDVYLCYKKSMNQAKLISYKPGILTRYPHNDHENFPFPSSVPLFCLPMGASIECWPSKAAQPRPVFSTFVLTVSDAAEKLYGSAVTFYERLSPDTLTAEQLKELELEAEDTEKTVNVNKCICLLSHWPFFDTFEKLLFFLYNMSCSGPHTVPIERYVSHFLEGVPFPSVHRPRILVQLSGTERVILTQPEDLPLPRSGASFRELLMNLGPENCLLVLLLALTEQKLLVHSLRPDVLTAISEAISMIIYPFKWQCPYIPLCPLGLAGVLHAPLPFLIGVDSRFFDLYDPPTDVNCVDLDTNTITICEEKRNLNIKLLPKKPARTLKSNLELLSQKIRQFVRSSSHDPGGKDGGIDRDFQIKRKEQCLELEIQEAFLRFMATILKGYRTYLLPITKAPTIGTTDPNSLFNLQGFLRSRDKTYHKFFSLVMKTQMFIRFIEERSFVSDMDAGLAFFDDCTEKVENEEVDIRLLELDESHQSERTVFIGPPEPTNLPTGAMYSYDTFTMNPVLFSRKDLKNLITETTRVSGTLQGSPMARRTKHEIKSAQKLARKFASSPDLWARCLLGTCFSMWFIHLPSYVSVSRSKASACLRTAYDLLVKMQKLKLQPTDEVCYRVMMQLCGLYNQPMLAVKLLSQMKRNGIQPNALTYGFYNRAVLDSAWPCHTSGQQLWNKLRNVVIGAALFRHGIRKHEDSISFTDMVDGASRTSIDSGSSHEQPELVKARLKGIADKCLSNGRSSMTNDLDFTTFDRYRNRHGSIVRPNGIPLLPSHVVLHQQPFESSAGLLMTSHFNGNTIAEEPADSAFDSLGESPPVSSRRRRTRSGSCSEFVFNLKSPGVGPNCPTSPKTPRSAEAPISPTENLKQLIRSQSFANDTRILDNLNRLKLGFQKDGLINGKVAPIFESNDFQKPPAQYRGSSSRSLFGRKSSFTMRQSRESSVENLEERSSAGSMDDIDSTSGYSPIRRSNPKLYSAFNRLSGDILERIDFKGSQDTNKQTSSVDSLLSDELTNSSSVGVKSASDVELCKQSKGDETENSEKSVLSAKVSSSSVKASPIRTTPVTQNDPLGALDMNDEVEVVQTNGDIQDSEGTSPNCSITSGNTVVLDMPEAAERPLLFGRGVSRSATFTSRHEEEEDDDIPQHLRVSGKSMQRSSTMPVDASTSSNMSSSGLGGIGSTFKLSFSNRFSPARLSLRARELRAGTQLIENALANFSPSNLTSKKSNEILQGGLNSLKSAATSVVKKFDEFKEAISVNSTPVKASTGSGRAADRDSMYSESDTADAAGNEGPSRRVSSEFSPLAVHMHLDYWGNNFLDIFGGEGSRKGSSSNLQPLGSPSTSQQQLLTESLYARDMSTRDQNAPVALEVSMSTCSKCHNCNCVLYDEEIMAGWVPEDSNLNTKCQFCNKATVPFLTVIVLDYRGHAMIVPVPNQDSGLTVPKGRHSLVVSNTSLNSSNNTESPNETERTGGGELGEENNKNISKMGEEASSDPISLEPITVPYLNPLVLRKEFENILYSEGDECLTRPQFVDEHPIIYWNLVWVFQRINVVSHLPSLCLQAVTINKNQNLHHPSWVNCDHNNVSIRMLWDNPRLHEEVGQPMYVLWQQNEQHSELVNALVTERTTLSRGVMQLVISSVRNSDLMEPLKKLAAERHKLKGRGVNRSHSLYREILFLAFTVMGRDNIDQAAFDREYVSAYERLTDADLKLLYKCDRPLSHASLQCRQYFKELDL